MLVFLAGPAFGDETIADPRFGLYVLAAGFVFQFFAELSDEDAEVFGLMRGLSAPDGSEQGAVRHDLARMPGEVEHQVELFGREVNRLALHGDSVRGCIHDEVAGLDGGGGAFGCTAKMGAHAGQQFLNAEGLGDVVIGAGVEGLNLGSFVVTNRKHEYRRRSHGAYGAADFNAAHAGHHQVGDDEVGCPLAEDDEAFFGIVGGAHIEGLRGESGPENPGDLRFVVDDQDPARHFSTCFHVKLTSSAAPVMMLVRKCGESPVAGMMRKLGVQEGLRWTASLVGVALITYLLLAVNIKETAAGLVFLTLVVWFAARSGIALSLFVAAQCAVSFDYFFLPPIHTFRLAGPQEWIEMLSFLISSAIVSRLAERTRQQSRNAEQRREDVERLYTLSQEMMLHEDASRIISDLPLMVKRCFELEAVVLYVGDRDQFYASSAEVPPGLQAELRAQTMGHSSMTSTSDGFTSLALMMGLTSIGALSWKPDSLSRELSTAVSAQVAIALTRSIAIETYTRLEASREGERLRTALIDSLTHELRTPLTSIRAAATTLVQAEGLDEATRSDLASLLDEESARLDKLIGEAVEMAELDAKVVRVQATAQHTRALLDHVVAESRSALNHRKVVISVEGPDTPVWFDPHLLSRVFRHLIENAARYSPAGSRIRLGSRRSEGRLEFSVEDQGPGIDPAEAPLIFEKFYRGEKSSAFGKGTGMGLPIVKAILVAHGGEITVASRPGEGSTFRFWIPLVEGEATLEAPAPAE